MANMDVKSFANADEVKKPDKILAQIINFGDVKITKLELEQWQLNYYYSLIEDFNEVKIQTQAANSKEFNISS